MGWIICRWYTGFALERGYRAAYLGTIRMSYLLQDSSVAEDNEFLLTAYKHMKVIYFMDYNFLSLHVWKVKLESVSN